MKKLQFIVLLQLLCDSLYGLHFTIIESQSLAAWEDMDNEWQRVIIGMGHTATISPQTTLDSNLFFSSTDILIISSGAIDIPPNRVNTILKFLMSGKPVYLQSEHLSTLSTNQAFEFIVTSLEGTFTWKNLFTGDLRDIKVIGSFRNTNNNVKSLKYYWYSTSGEGDCRMIYFLQYGGEYHGFQYIPLNPLYGSIISTTDQDWIQDGTSPKLMENIVTHLISYPINTSNNLNVSIGTDTSLCLGDTIVLDATTASASYLWQDNSTNSTLTVSQSGTYQVEVKNSCGIATDAIEINFLESPVVNLASDTSICDGSMLILNATTSNGSYLWSDGSINSFLNVVMPGSYWVEVNNNCAIDTFITNVSLDDCKCSIYIPNIFTPNGDNANDNFSAISNCHLFDYSLSIFDRWGNVVFESSDQDASWNGTYRGNIAPNGVYVFRLTYAFIAQSPETIYGSVTLIN